MYTGIFDLEYFSVQAKRNNSQIGKSMQQHQDSTFVKVDKLLNRLGVYESTCCYNRLIIQKRNENVGFLYSSQVEIQITNRKRKLTTCW